MNTVNYISVIWLFSRINDLYSLNDIMNFDYSFYPFLNATRLVNDIP